MPIFPDKVERIAQRSLRVILNQSHYPQPTAREGWTAEVLLGYRLELKDGTLYPDKKAKAAFYDVVRAIAQLPDVARRHSRDAVYRASKEALESLVDVCGDFNATAWLRSISDALADNYSEFRFWEPIVGVRLNDINELDLGAAILRTFSDSEIAQAGSAGSGKLDTLVAEKFVGKLVLTAVTAGDQERATAAFEETREMCVALIRFLMCYSYELGYSARKVRIDIAMNRFTGIRQLLGVDTRRKTMVAELTYARSEVDVSKEMILAECLGSTFRDVVQCVWALPPTQMESSIRAAVYWIGQGQDEPNSESAFVKYWTALEVFFSLDKDAITQRLANSVSVACRRFGHFLVRHMSAKEAYKEIARLYRLRSKVLHRGMTRGVRQIDLRNVANFAVAVVFIALYARRQGCTDLSQFNHAIGQLAASLQPEAAESSS